ncbi:MAG: hypothetical protein AB7U75_20875 [Hyphomicrobiaceae bacterium]
MANVLDGREYLGESMLLGGGNHPTLSAARYRIEFYGRLLLAQG